MFKVPAAPADRIVSYSDLTGVIGVENQRFPHLFRLKTCCDTLNGHSSYDSKSEIRNRMTAQGALNWLVVSVKIVVTPELCHSGVSAPHISIDLGRRMR